MKDKSTMNITEAAEFLGLHRHTVRALAERGDLPGQKLGRQWRFLRSALESYLSQPTTKTNA